MCPPYEETRLTKSSTGASGFIGGDALYALEKAHPDWEFSILVRSKDSGAKIQKAHPKVNLVIGSLDDSETVANAAAAADIVVRMSTIRPPRARYRKQALTMRAQIRPTLRTTRERPAPLPLACASPTRPRTPATISTLAAPASCVGMTLIMAATASHPCRSRSMMISTAWTLC